MAETQRRYSSRSNRPKKPRKSNTILNGLIGLVVLLIVLTGGIIFLGEDKQDVADSNNEATKVNTEETSDSDIDSDTNDSEDTGEGLTTEEIEPTTEDEEAGQEEAGQEDGASDEEGSTTDESGEDTTTPGGTVTSTPSEDPLVSETIVNTAWKPIGTTQTGDHVSVYQEGHVDWQEKIKALSYASGLAEDNMIIWQIGNGGSAHKSIGVVSSNDKAEKYRIWLQWVEGEGWKPEKMETLKTLEGAY